MKTAHQTTQFAQAPHVDFTVQCELSFDYAGADFADLFERSTATSFQHPIWMKHFTAIVVPSRNAKSIAITIKDASGTLVGVMPMTLRRFGGARLLEAADLGVCDYCAPVIDTAIIEPLTAAELMAAKLPPHDVLRLRNIRPEYVDFFERLSGTKSNLCDFSSHCTALGPDIEQWRTQALSPTFRKNLARKVRKAHGVEGLSVQRVTDGDEAANAVNALPVLRKNRFEGDMVALPAITQFYSTVAREGINCNYSRVCTLTLDKKIIGVLFGTCHAETFHYLLVGYDYANYSSLSPGMVLNDFTISDWAAAGGTHFDFTIGDEAYKMDFGTVATPISAIETSRTMIGKLALLARGLRDRLKQRPQG